MITATRLAEYVTVIASLVGGSMWIGSQGTQIETLQKDADDLKTVPADIAVLQEQNRVIQKTLDELVAELRRRR